MNVNGGVEAFIYYIYDASGIAGFFVKDSYYYFTKNLFGDIIGIENEANELVGAYTYNAWGECTIKTNVDGIATLNPFCYRGYYYDSETGFYYLQTRYYDPEICRFISADDPEILGDLASVVGQLNLYAYCLNNPVMFVDPTGTWTFSFGISADITVFFFGASIAIWVAFDDDGNIALQWSYSLPNYIDSKTNHLGFLDVGVSPFVQYTGDDTAYDMEGISSYMGASFGPGWFLGLDAVFSGIALDDRTNPNKTADGFSIYGGIGLGVDVHLKQTYTQTIGGFNIKNLLGGL